MTHPKDKPVTQEQINNLESVQARAADLVDYARERGVIVTIDNKPLLPLAMGHAVMTPEVRLVHEQS